MSDAMRRLWRDGSSASPAAHKLHRRIEARGLDPEELRRDPAFQADPTVSYTPSSGSLEQALHAYRTKERRVTLLAKKDER